jgi:mono/diheme cytochrome c family protein
VIDHWLRLLALASCAACGCDARETLVTPDPHLERMLDQRRADPYERSDFFPDGKTMQVPPRGAVAYDEPTHDEGATEGFADGAFLTKIPVVVTRDLVRLGQSRFDIFCATCHGVLGDGDSPVAFNMQLRKPPSLVDAPVIQYPPGQIFSTITVGYGLMPSYASQLDVHERWAIVGYVQALAVAHRSNVRDLPPSVRAELAKAAPP